jgi:hypothetical protein
MFIFLPMSTQIPVDSGEEIIYNIKAIVRGALK